MPAAVAVPAAHPVSVTTSRTWTVPAHVDRHPTRVPEGPRTNARPRRLHVGCDPRRHAPGKNQVGEGTLSLTMAAPGTSWASPTTTSAVVDVRVDRLPEQQVVLFDGAQPFRYEMFLGRLRTGSHCLRVTVDTALSSDTAAPRVQVYAADLDVVPRGSPGYQITTHAPILYGRSTSAQRNAQLLTYGQATPDPDGRDTDLSYTVIWTREDVGDGIVPAYEWGLFGRMTDIETVLKEKVAPNGTIRSAQYLSCGCEKFPVFPDQTPAPPVDSEQDTPYPSSGTPAALGHHLALRDASGNNDESPHGTTAYRVQQLPVRGPAPGQSREVAMDRHPWTYRLSEQELARSTVQSTDPRSLLAGVYPQYLVVDIDAQATGASSIAIEVKLSGDPTWYSDDYAQTTAPGPPTTYPFYDGGHARTVVKLPTDWHGRRIVAARLRLDAPAGSPAAHLDGTPHVELIEVTRHYHVVRRPVPRLTTTTGTQLLPGVPG